MTALLETDPGIRSAIDAKAIALKLIEGSENAKMFTSIYPEKPAPTVYVISHLGVLLTSFSDSLPKESFIGKLNEVGEASKPPVQPPVQAAPAAEASSSSADQTKPEPENRTIEEKKKELLERIKENREKNKKQNEDRAKNQEVERIKAGKHLVK